MLVHHIQVRRAHDQRILALATLPLFGIHPVERQSRRVVAVEDPEALTAAAERVEDAPHRVDAVELVHLLEPHACAVPGGELGALQLQRIVRATEHDALPRGKVRQLHRRHPTAEEPLQPQRRHSPHELLVHRIAQRVAEATNHHGIGEGVGDDEQHQAQADERRLGGTAPAVQPVVDVPAAHHIPQHAVEHARAQIGDAHALVAAPAALAIPATHALAPVSALPAHTRGLTDAIHIHTRCRALAASRVADASASFDTRAAEASASRALAALRLRVAAADRVAESGEDDARLAPMAVMPVSLHLGEMASIGVSSSFGENNAPTLALLSRRSETLKIAEAENVLCARSFHPRAPSPAIGAEAVKPRSCPRSVSPSASTARITARMTGLCRRRVFLRLRQPAQLRRKPSAAGKPSCAPVRSSSGSAKAHQAPSVPHASWLRGCKPHVLQPCRGARQPPSLRSYGCPAPRTACCAPSGIAPRLRCAHGASAPSAPPSHASSFPLAFGGSKHLARLSSAGCQPSWLAALCVMPPGGLQRFALPARPVSCPTLRATFGVAPLVGQPFGLPSARQATSGPPSAALRRLAGGRRALRSRRRATSPHQPISQNPIHPRRRPRHQAGKAGEGHHGKPRCTA